MFPPESHWGFPKLQDFQPQWICSAGNREADAPLGQHASCTPQSHLETLSHPPGFPSFPAGEEKRFELTEEGGGCISSPYATSRSAPKRNEPVGARVESIPARSSQGGSSTSSCPSCCPAASPALAQAAAGPGKPCPTLPPGVKTPHWDMGSVPKSLLNSKVEHLRCSSTCRDGNVPGAKLRAQGWPLSPS